MITQQRLKSLLNYDPKTGLFTWIATAKTGNHDAFVLHAAGDAAGSISGIGYARVTIDGQRYYCHRLAWFYMMGAWPTHEIDHKNGDRGDNRWANIRHATRRLNAQNMRKARTDSNSGCLGVSWDSARSKWVARIKISDNYKFLGRFATKELASTAYIKAKRNHHKGCTI